MRVVMFPDFSEGNPYQQELRAGLEARGVSVSIAGQHGPSRWVRRLFPLLGSLRDTGAPDVVHLHWIHPFFNQNRPLRAALGGFRLLLELAVLRLMGIGVVWTIHNLLDHDRCLPERLEVAIRHATFWLCDGVIVHCDRAAGVVIQTYGLPARAERKLTTVPHGHYVDSYENEFGMARARSRLGVADDATAFLYFGRIRAYKNVPALVSAFKRLDRDDVRLLVVGDPYAEALRSEVAARSADDDRIRTRLEHVPDADVQCYMNAADVVVLPFNDILSSGSAMLAMSFARPVIAPAMGCVASLVSDGLAYDPADPDGLYRSLERALELDLQAIAARNERRARAFDWERIAARTESAYRAAAS